MKGVKIGAYCCRKLSIGTGILKVLAAKFSHVMAPDSLWIPRSSKAKDSLGGTELLGRGLELTCDSTRGGMQEPAQVDADAEGKDVELQR